MVRVRWFSGGLVGGFIILLQNQEPSGDELEHEGLQTQKPEVVSPLLQRTLCSLRGEEPLPGK